VTVPAWVKASAASLSLGAIIPKSDPPTPTKLAPTPAEISTPKVLIECIPVQALRPAEKRRKQIAKETGIALPSAVTLEGVKDAGPGKIMPQIASSEPVPDFPVLMVDGRPYPPSPDGGRIWSLLEMDGSNTLVVLPNPDKPKPEDRFWSLSAVYELGAMVDLESLLASETKDWKVYGAVEFGRAGRLRPRLQVEGESRAGEKDLRAWGGLVWRSK
jgi:hypothetical protein